MFQRLYDKGGENMNFILANIAAVIPMSQNTKEIVIAAIVECFVSTRFIGGV